MAERKKIGLLFGYSEGWIAGTYYFINLVHALKELHDSLKPEIIIVTGDVESYNRIKETGYPYLQYLPAHQSYSIPQKAINKLWRAITGKTLINKSYNENQLPVLFGYYELLFFYKCKRKIYWIPDLQDCHYPQYLGEDVAVSRKKQHMKLAYSKTEVVFSSEDSKKDFDTFYPDSTCQKYVVPFAVTLPAVKEDALNTLLDKYKLPSAYFIAPNQFWSHKNHITVIKAIALLKEKDIYRHVVFTGNENTGNGQYAKELKNYVKEKELSGLIHFLGFIDRQEQLLLTKNSVAIIQPSLFEGWSTVIEDAKAMNKYLIASNLPVHREQLKGYEAKLFEPLNVEALASLLSEPIQNKELHSMDYKNNVMRYANRFMQVIDAL